MSKLAALNWSKGTTFVENLAGRAKVNTAVALLGLAGWWGNPPGNNYLEDNSGLDIMLPSPHA